jgi:hypothetical protein
VHIILIPKMLHHLQPADQVLPDLVVQWLHLHRTDVLQTWLMGEVDVMEQTFVAAAEGID